MPTEHVIVDTDAFSFLLTNKPQSAAYPDLLRGKVAAVSFVTVAELRYGALSAGWGERRTNELEDTLRKFLKLPYHDGLASLWARLKRDARQNGHPLAQPEHGNDLWIAACGAYFQAPILTGNARHFNGLPGIRVIDGS